MQGQEQTGDMVVHAKVAEAVLDIFAAMHAARYPLEKMVLIDAYDADDVRSCADNNTSGFCSRPITGSTTEWSMHSFGVAIDVNPRLNPYRRGDTILPPNGAEYLDRARHAATPGVVMPGDACHAAFTAAGWLWGGDWLATRGYVDYQHFYFGASTEA
jgi:hypothetical protein